MPAIADPINPYKTKEIEAARAALAPTGLRWITNLKTKNRGLYWPDSKLWSHVVVVEKALGPNGMELEDAFAFYGKRSTSED